MSVREQAKSARRRRITAAARVLLRNAGESGFSMRSLAEQAGVSMATPYNLFGSKQAVLLAVMDEDLASYQDALADLHADGIEVLFQAVALLTGLLAEDPGFHRQMLAALHQDGGIELRQMVTGPRYLLWKALLRQATDSGLLRKDLDPDAFAITLSQGLSSNLQEWALGQLSLDEMDARSRYGLALGLLAAATPGEAFDQVQAELRRAEARLQALWRSALQGRLQAGDLDPASRALGADQLRHLPPDNRVEPPKPAQPSRQKANA